MNQTRCLTACCTGHVGCSVILRVLMDARGQALTKQQVADAAGYEVSGGGFGNALSWLRTLELFAGKAELRVSVTLIGR